MSLQRYLHSLLNTVSSTLTSHSPLNPRPMLLAGALVGATLIGASAQTPKPGVSYRLPGQHNAEHADLIAGQINIKDQVKSQTTQQFMDSYFTEEEEPELDIYDDGWNSQHVNCYRESDVPQRHVIDVSRFAMPCPGYITSPYGYRRRFRRMHKGVDLKLQTGDTVYAAFTGKVRLTRYEGKGYGNYVVLRHENDMETVYAHLSKTLVKPNQYVKAGDPIALGGNTGRSFGSHLHFETRFMGYAINPCAIFDFANQTVHTDEYTFDKRTYTQARDFSPAATQAHRERYMANSKSRRGAGAASNASSGRHSGNKATASTTIRKGDTLSRIARRSGTSVQQLCRLNGISTTSTLRPGHKLKTR